MDSKKIKHIMLDLETLSTEPTAAVAAIGAVSFTVKDGIIETFYKVIDIQSCIDKDLTISGTTIMWWLSQNKNAREELTRKNRKPLQQVLENFTKWLEPDSKVHIWGNGSDFDNAILTNAYRKCRMLVPWEYYRNRCYRTLIKSFPIVPIKRNKENLTHHSAIDDAKYQALNLVRLIKAYEIGYVLDN